MANIEGAAASNLSTNSGKGVVQDLFKKLGSFGGKKKDSSSSGGTGLTAADWHNQELSKRYDHGRTLEMWDRHDGRLKEYSNRDDIRGFSSKPGGAFDFSKNPPVVPDAPKKKTVSGKSGVAQGKQFKGRAGNYRDTRAAVAGGHITEEDAVQISPTYAKKYAEKAAAKKSETPAIPKQRSRGSKSKTPKA